MLTRRELVVLLGVLALGACRSGGAPASRKPQLVAVEGSATEARESTAGMPTAATGSAAFVSASAEAEAAPAAGEHSIVWGVYANQSERVSFLLEWHAPELKVLGRRSGPVIATDSGIYRFHRATGKGTGFESCDEAW